MVPDLPGVLPDVPDSSGSGRSRWRALRPATRVRWARPSVVLLAAAVAVALAGTLGAPAALADDLTDRRRQVERQLTQTRTELNESSQDLTAAAAAVDTTAAQLQAARDQLAETQRQLGVAAAQDAEVARQLKRARAELAAAKAAVRQGQADLDTQHAVIGKVVRDQYQQQTNLLPVAALLSEGNTADLQTRLQWSTTLFDTSQATYDDLVAVQRRLTEEKARQARLEAQVAAERTAAAENLKVKQRLEAQAERQEAGVAALLDRAEQTRADAADEVAADRAQYAELTAERASVERRIAARVAAARAAEAAAKRKAEAAARARAAAAERERAQARKEARRSASAREVRRSTGGDRQASSGSRSSAPSAAATTPRPSTPAGSGGFLAPVAGPVTSAYGMRFHPVLRYWKLHDGTDFGAGCGTAIRAPYAGRVAERYYNGGYGNRLMIDHGVVDGRYVTTGYNHAVRYTVGVGQSVSRGQVIGYVGSTGYSTGCHLHLMVWTDGRLVNPMTWF